MDLKLLCLIIIASIGCVLCDLENEDRDKLHDAVFKQTEPALERIKVLEMLLKLKKLYEKDDPELRRINLALKIGEVSIEKCNDSVMDFQNNYNLFDGRAHKLLKESQELQAKLCLNLWTDSFLRRISYINESDRELVSSIIKSMIEANGGKQFDGDGFDMAYPIAQEGVLQYLQNETGITFSKWTQEDKFNKIFDQFVSEPCGRAIERLHSEADRFVFLMTHMHLDNQLDPKAVVWARNKHICELIKGYGYSSSPSNSFRKDTFKNFVNGKASWLLGRRKT